MVYYFARASLGILFVVFIEVEDDVVRVISARKATPHERQKYRKSQSKA
jgi:uncharacterized DUF497 family protein